MSLVAAMAAHAARRAARLKREAAAEDPRELVRREPRGLAQLLARPTPRRVAEVRFASADEGFRVPREQANAEEAALRARAASAGGAHAISVWTERHFHAGDWTHLSAARRALPDAVLIARDLVVDEYQLDLARARGADAVTLWGAVSGQTTPALAAAARARGLGVIVEAANAAQLELARLCGADAVLAPSRPPGRPAPDMSAARAVAARGRGLPVFIEAETSEGLVSVRTLDAWAPADLG